MSIAKSPLSAVTESDLQALIAGGVREDRTIEFKRESYGRSDDARAEFLKDVSSLANTLGGDLLLGMDEEQGVASALPGLPAGTDLDQEMTRLSLIAQTGLQPRLPPLDMHPVPLAAGGHALVIRVRRSYHGPHRVILGGRNSFWARAGARRYEPDVGELRALFSAAPQLAARLRELRGERVAQVLAEDTPIPLIKKPGICILHIIPLAAAAETSFTVDLDCLFSQRSAWFPWTSNQFEYQRNYDGFVSHRALQGKDTYSYCQVFRSGMVEVVAANQVGIRDQTREVRVDTLAYQCSHQILAVLPALRRARVDPPYSIQITMAGVLNASFAASDMNRFSEASSPINRDVLVFADSVVADEDLTREQVAKAVRPTLDHMFQTASYPTTPWFHPDGTLEVR